MADDIKLSTTRPGTGRLNTPLPTPDAVTAPLTPQAPVPSTKAKTDTLRLSSEAAAEAGLGVSNVKDIARSVGAVQNERKLASEYQARINALVPGGVSFETHGGGAWASHELRNLMEVVETMSPTDRQALSGMAFVRAGKIDMAQGGAEAVANQLGDAMGDAAAEGAGASARMGKPQEATGFMGRVKDFVLQSAEVMEGIPILRFFGKALKNLFGQQGHERAIVFGNAGTLISKDLFAHEIGHQVQMANRGWDPARIAEFSKLSGWTETYGGKQYGADGVDNRTGERMLFDEQVQNAKRNDNFVSKYAMTSPTEDFAESYRMFLTDPTKMMDLAPDKFLYLNATSQRYNASEVKGYAQQAGQDLEAVATELTLNSGLRQETLNSILTVNGVSPDKASLASAASSGLTTGDPLSQAWAKIATDARNPQSAAKLLANPAEALGGVWSKLSPDEQALLSDRSFMQGRLGELQAGFASYASAADATETELHRQAVSTLVDRLMNDAAARAQLKQDPQAALAGLNLPEQVQDAFIQRPEAVAQLVDAIGSLMDGATAAQKAQYRKNLEEAVAKCDPVHFAAFADSLNNPDPTLAARKVTHALQTGSVVYQSDDDPPGV